MRNPPSVSAFTPVVAALVGGAFLTAGAAAAQPGGAIYVSPTGSDTATGLTPDQPFASLERARAALRASPIKTVFLEGGVYPRTATLALTAADAGESWLAMPGQTPVLDGGGTVKRGISISGAHITVRWLTVQNYAETGIFAQNADDVIIDSNTVRNTASTAWNQGGIVSIGNFVNGRITHNLVRNSQYDGILSATSEKDSITGLLIQDNAVYDSCTKVADCGAIHANDRGHASINIRINHNLIGRFGSDRLQSKGIYLDDLLSNTAVTNNIVFGNGQYAIQVHGGDHNVVENNIFDIRQATAAVLYQVRSPGHMMEGNVFRCNIIYSRRAAPHELWRNLGGGTPATEDRNLYWNARRQSDFADPDSRNYALRSRTAPNFCGFRQIDTGDIGPLPNN